MYDQDPVAESDDKCDFCELWANCTGKLKAKKCCFEPSDRDG
jgi:predicted RecB family nuclease